MFEEGKTTTSFLAFFYAIDPARRNRELPRSCVEVLFDYMMNPPVLDDEVTTVADVDATERAMLALVAAEARKMRELLRLRSQDRR